MSTLSRACPTCGGPVDEVWLAGRHAPERGPEESACGRCGEARCEAGRSGATSIAPGSRRQRARPAQSIASQARKMTPTTDTRRIARRRAVSSA